jgi:hypothetical protein
MKKIIETIGLGVLASTSLNLFTPQFSNAGEYPENNRPKVDMEEGSIYHCYPRTFGPIIALNRGNFKPRKSPIPCEQMKLAKYNDRSSVFNTGVFVDLHCNREILLGGISREDDRIISYSLTCFGDVIPSIKLQNQIRNSEEQKALQSYLQQARAVETLANSYYPPVQMKEGIAYSCKKGNKTGTIINGKIVCEIDRIGETVLTSSQLYNVILKCDPKKKLTTTTRYDENTDSTNISAVCK